MEERQDLPKGVTQPLPMNYHLELDDSPLLGDVDAQLYMSYIGILQWAVELRRIDLALPVSTVACYMACQRHGHMKHVLQIVAFLKSHLNSRLVLDPVAQDWSDKEWSVQIGQSFFLMQRRLFLPMHQNQGVNLCRLMSSWMQHM